MTRIPKTSLVTPRDGDALIMRKRGGGERRVPAGKWWVNRNTPVGDDAELMERMPHHGYRYLDWCDLIAVERPEPVRADQMVTIPAVAKSGKSARFGA